MPTPTRDRVLFAVFGLWVLACLFLAAASAFIVFGPGSSLTEQRYVTDPLEGPNLKAWYDADNEEYFNNKLPHDTVVEYGTPLARDGHEVIAMTTQVAGVFHIVFSRKYALANRVSHLFLIHESCHLESWAEFDEHGPKWKACMHRVEAAGAYEDLL